MYGSSGTSSAQILSNKLNECGIQSRIFNPTILQRVFCYRSQVVNNKDNPFIKDDAIAQFGVGKNMVNAIKHWAVATGFLETTDESYAPSHYA